MQKRSMRYSILGAMDIAKTVHAVQHITNMLYRMYRFRNDHSSVWLLNVRFYGMLNLNQKYMLLCFLNIKSDEQWVCYSAWAVFLFAMFIVHLPSCILGLINQNFSFYDFSTKVSTKNLVLFWFHSNSYLHTFQKI